jgi:hypothetical protein
MLPIRSMISVLLLLGAAPVRAISFDCVPPVFPARQVSQDELRRIDQQVRAWNACYAAFSATHRSIDATRQDHEVANELAKWSSSMRNASRPVDGADRREVLMRHTDQQPASYSRDRR